MRLLTPYPCSLVILPVSARRGLCSQSSMGWGIRLVFLIMFQHPVTLLFWLPRRNEHKSLVTILQQGLSMLTRNATKTALLAFRYRLLYIAYSNGEGAGAAERTRVAQQFLMPLHLNSCPGIHPTTEGPSSCSVQTRDARGCSHKCQ